MTDSDDYTPPHMRQLPAQCVERIAELIASDFAGVLPITLRFELEAWRNTRTVWDAERVAKACAHAYAAPLAGGGGARPDPEDGGHSGAT